MDILTYDVKDEQEYLKNYQNPIMKFYKYKTAKGDFDCDVSSFALEAARKLYPFLATSKMTQQQGSNNKFELHLQDSPLVYRGDTCNSFHTLYRIAVTTLIPKKDYLDICNHYGDAGNEYLRDLLAKHDGLSKDFETKLPTNIGSLFTEFAVINHTLSNMIALPRGLNVPRYHLTADNFSFFLYAAYLHLDKKDSYLLEGIFRNEIELAVGYLNSFSGWRIYIEMNCLESYLDDRYVPKEFIKGQFQKFINLVEKVNTSPLNRQEIEKYTCPQTSEEFSEYLQNVVTILRNRGERMSFKCCN